MEILSLFLCLLFSRFLGSSGNVEEGYHYINTYHMQSSRTPCPTMSVRRGFGIPLIGKEMLKH